MQVTLSADPGKKDRDIIVWLAIVCLMILGTIIVGGITRLTGSGLSIVDWSPIVGVIPPLSESDWMLAFDKYKQFPQYKLINSAMSLDEFKGIFFWEYFHRILGRLIGAVFALGLVYFGIRRRLSAPLAWRLILGLVLGGAQGLLGWYMVKSGLINKPYVSHYRLAAHLGLALLVLLYLISIMLDLLRLPRVAASPGIRKLARTLFFIVAVQIILGAFTAGLHAGIGYNTFPTMNGEWVPLKIFDLRPAWLNFFENTVMIQFAHRGFGWLILIASLGLVGLSHKSVLTSMQRNAMRCTMAAVILQFILGVLTLIHAVPIPLAVTHQLGATVLLVSLFWLNYLLGPETGQLPK